MSPKSPLKVVTRINPDRDPSSPRNRHVPIPETIQYVHGYPKKLTLYKIESSRFYQVRLYFNERYHRKTTQTESLKDARKFAVKFYEDVLFTAKSDKISDKTKSFAVIGGRYMKSVEKTTLKTSYRTDFSRYKNDILPFFGEQEIDTITNSKISEFVARLKDRELSTATIKHFMVVLRKIFKYAIANDLMRTLPVFPKVSGRLLTTQKRDYLTKEEYEHLHKTAMKLAEEGVIVRGVPITLEMKYLIQFMVNSFIRPSDIRVLKHKHISKVKEGKDEWLVLNHPATKTTATEVQAMPVSVPIYEELLRVKENLNHPRGSDDFVFFPQYVENRNTAMEVIGRLFRKIVAESGLEDRTGKNITLYSLRHTAIMMRLIIGKVDSLALARNARTSAAMVDKFYAYHLTTNQVRKQLHAFPDKVTPTIKKKTAVKKSSPTKKTVKKTSIRKTKTT